MFYWIILKMVDGQYKMVSLKKTTMEYMDPIIHIGETPIRTINISIMQQQ